MQKIRDIIPSLELWATGPDASIAEAARVMTNAGIGALAVVNEYGQLIGIITERDLITRVMVHGVDPENVKVRDVMTRDVEVVELNAPTLTALEKMTRRNCRHLPVMDGDQVVSMLSVKDLLRAELKYREQMMSQAIGELAHHSEKDVMLIWQCHACGHTVEMLDYPHQCPQCEHENTLSLKEIKFVPEA